MSLTAGQAFDRLVDIMRTLRSPSGCPWDREQTLASLEPFLLEETYEALDAIERDDMKALAEELGDLLFEIVFLAEIGTEVGDFTIVDSLNAARDKLVRRHPHVFDSRREGTDGHLSATQVLERWETLKARERMTSGDMEGVLGGIPRILPALLRAHEIGERASAVGFDWPDTVGVVDKIEEEVRELKSALAAQEGPSRIEEEVGDLLFAIANLSRKLGVEPESALRRANDKFTKRFAKLEQSLRLQGVAWPSASLDELERQWARIKETE